MEITGGFGFANLDSSLVAVALATGAKLWSYAWDDRSGRPVPSSRAALTSRISRDRRRVVA